MIAHDNLFQKNWQRPAVRRLILDMGWVLCAGIFGALFVQMPSSLWSVHLAGVVITAFCAGLLQNYLQLFRLRKFPVAIREWRLMWLHALGVFGIATLMGVAFRFDAPLGFGVVTGLLATAVMIWDRYQRGLVAQLDTDSVEIVKEGKRALLIGAGSAAEMLLAEFERQRPHVTVVGLLDDDAEKVGSLLHGKPVLGGIDQLREIVPKEQIDEVILAIPSLDRIGQQRILGLCEGVGAKLWMMPSISRQLAEAGHGLPKLREVAPEEMLRRDSIETDMSVAAGYVCDRVILITGGGGSIGSELARQIATLRPKQIVLLGKGENSIFESEQELRSGGFGSVVPVIGDVRDRATMDRVMGEYGPEVVFHAAAHKHVPLMERVPIEAVRNNIFGTLNVAQAAMAAGVKKFILISTDKAVNPTNVMGATKRAAEIVIMALAGRSQTQFAAVRFGNVLGSRGSLIPILKKQIAKGGPVTITDERMTRFFMTIPEAAQLVIQAGSHGGAGEIFILDMGEPVKIVDVVRGLLKLYGLEEGKDIEVEFIGARPGEKIHEELSWESEDLERIDGGKVLRLKSLDRVGWEILEGRLLELGRLCEVGDGEAVRQELMELVEGSPEKAVGGDRGWPSERTR
ncbi:hypothetical protein CCB80_12380 [Armatimonadetes bacterium Uphvl-Ar1]|nr:hypothetical protein CCB80_12380 [Armatimonadetes bacterium Uphvl-Ar1]